MMSGFSQMMLTCILLLVNYMQIGSSEQSSKSGASQMLGKKITVRFCQQTDFERRPVAHTCGCILELASSFKDYIEFRAEFTSVLDSKIWIMDIV